MGVKLYNVPISGVSQQRDGFEIYCSKMKEEKRQEALSRRKAAIEHLSEPMAIFATIYERSEHKKYKLVAICERSKQAKHFAKAVAKFAKGKNNVVINSFTPGLKKAVRKQLRKADKPKVKVHRFNRGTPDITTIFIVD